MERAIGENMAKKLVLKHLTDYDTKPLSSDKVIDKKRFHPEGLYGEKIFGPIKDFICLCGTYSPFGGVCKTCGVRYEKSDNRAKKFGHIELPIEIINPLFLWNLNANTKSTTKINIMDLIYYKQFLIIKNDEPKSLFIEDFEIIKKTHQTYTGAYAIKKLLDWLYDKKSKDPKFKIGNYMRESLYEIMIEKMDFLILDRILVVPPDLRPILFTGNKMVIQEQLSRLYTTLLTKLNIMNNKTNFIKGVGDKTFKNYADIQKMCVDIYEDILGVFGGKTGLMRGNILGKRIDYSGRAVIAIDPSLKYNECRIPYYILLEVYKYSIAREISKKNNSLIFDVLNNIEDSLKAKDFRYIHEVEEYVKDECVALNRQPTLHKIGLIAWNIKVSTDYTIKIHPFACTAYNADFDGDSMACYFPITEEAKEDLRKNVHIENNLFTDYDKNQLTLMPGHDIVYGIYILSLKRPEKLPSPLYEYMKEKDWKYINKKRLTEFLCSYIRMFPKNASIIDDISNLGFTISTRYNQTKLSIDNIIDSIIPLEKRKDLYDRYINEEITMKEYMEEEEKMQNDLKDICIFTDLIESGSRGSWLQAKQMFLQRGFVSNSIGQIMDKPVYHNLAEGLNSRELFLSCYGVRKGLADVADNTAVSGTFSRGLIYLGLEAKMGDHKKPCNTERYLSVHIKDFKMAESLVNRYVFKDDDCKEMERIKREEYDKWVGQTVRLRSPIFCTNKNFCHYCAPFKELKDIVKGKTYNLGLNAAGSLGEPTTQMVLRVFHNSGATTKVVEDEDNDDIIQDLRGAIALFSKPNFDFDNLSSYIMKIYKTYSSYKKIPYLYFETLVSQLMWAKSDLENTDPDTLWRLNQELEMILVGFNKVPGLSGFLLGCAFKNFKRRLLTSLDKVAGDSIFERLILD